MKKLYISALVLASFAFGNIANAQWTPPATLPVISGTDINGNVHNIQTYLSQGKTVLIDVSATWCGPCWGLHQSHWLEDVHRILGPNGTDDVVVLWVEGDASTGTADLNGTTSSSQGDWTDGVTYPIIDDANFTSQFNVSYFPTVFTICPDGTMSEVNRNTEAALFTSIMTCSGVELPMAESNLSSGQGSVCGTEDVSVPYTINNFGQSALTSGTINVKDNSGTVVHTEAFSGNIASLGSENGSANFTLSGVTTASQFNVEYVSGNTELYSDNNDADITGMIVPELNSTSDFFMTIHTDSFPSETKAYVFSQSGALLYETPNFQANTLPNGSYGTGGPDADKLFHFNFSANANECVQVFGRDTYGDGLSRPGTNGAYIKIIDGQNNEIVNMTDANGAFGLVGKYVHTTEAVSVEENTVELSFFPNPAVDFVVVSNSEFVGEHVIVTDMNGKVVISENLAADNKIAVSSLPVGNYVLTISNTSAQFTVNK
ncbi:MAG: T9SS type A sorting domain-containing protein [Flavobacteriales bacterium]